MKIKYSILPKLANLTASEMEFFLYLARHQNDKTGRITGVHNQVVCKATGICKQSFYTAMRRLQQRQLIVVNKNTDSDYDIQILDNDFPDYQSYQAGYVNLNREVFHSRNFKRLKANEKWLLMDLLKITHENAKSYEIGTRKFYKKYKEFLGVTKRIVRYYLHSLRKFFSIGIKKGKYYITYLHSVMHQKYEKTEGEQEREYLVRTWCRRMKLKAKAQAIADTAEVIKQYRPVASRRGFDIEEAVRQCMQYSMSSVSELHPKYINKLVQNLISEPASKLLD